MKVLHLISGGDTGGAKTHVFALLDALTKMADVKIVCLTPGVFYQQIIERPVDSLLVEQKNRFDLSVVRTIADLIRNEGFMLVHAHGARANFIAQYLKKRVHVPVVTTVHSDYLLDFDGFYRKLVYTGLNIHALKKMDYYIGVSSKFRDMLIQRGFRPNRVFTVYNGMDYSGTPTFINREAFAERIGIPYESDKIYVGLIGRHDRVKGHDIFIRAAAKAAKVRDDLRFIIAGDGEGREGLVQLAENEGISDKLIFSGFIDDIYSFINFIDINTLSSRSESFPYVLLEGARMQKPTISAAVGGIPDLITDGETGLLFPAEDVDGFAEKILYMAEDKERRNKMGKALYEKATRSFSNTSLAESHVEIYKAILRDFQDKKAYDVVLSGYYGFHNSGDDALLLAILESIKKRMPDVRALVLSDKPHETMCDYRVDAMHRFHLLNMKRAFKNAHMLLFGGGSLLQDVTSKQSFWYYLNVMKMARRNGAKVYVYANGIGPLCAKNRKKAARELEKCDLITLRDTASRDELSAMGVTGVPMHITADPALSLDSISIEAARALLEKEGLPPDKKYFGIALRPWQNNDKKFIEKVAKIAEYAADKYGLVPLFIPMKKATDMKMAERLATLMQEKLYVLEKEYPVREMVGIVRSCAFLLGMRLHTLVYGVGGCVPVIGLSYDPKVDGFMEYIGENSVVDVENFNLETVCDFIDSIYKDYEKYKERLEARAENLCEKAEKNADFLISMLQE